MGVGVNRNKKAYTDLNQVKSQIKDWEWDKRFRELLDEDLIEIDDEEFYKEKLQFTENNELNDIFASLETKNLFYINQAQDIEQQLDTTK